jgi:hypothetical protein
MLSRRTRWSVPVVVLLAGVGLGVVPGLSASAGPALPAITAQALLAKVLSTKVNAFSGMIQTSTDLGLPSIPGGDLPGAASGLLSLLTGSNTARVWLDEPAGEFRGAWLQSGQESDLYITPSHIYTWDSASDSVGEAVPGQLAAEVAGGGLLGSPGLSTNESAFLPTTGGNVTGGPLVSAPVPPPDSSGWTGYAPLSASTAVPRGESSTLSVILTPRITAAQESAVVRALRSQPDVTSVRVVSRAAQLDLLRRTVAGQRGMTARARARMLRQLRSGPLPGSVTAAMKPHANLRALVARLASLPGVRGVSGFGSGALVTAGGGGRQVSSSRIPTAAAALGGVTPSSVATQVLSGLGTESTISVGRTATVAGRAAYILEVTPKASDSLVASVDLAVDAKTGLPLRVQVLARGQSAPAVSIGFSSLSIGAPPSSLFDFTVPSGSSVHQLFGRHANASPAAPTGGSPGITSSGPSKVIGTGWAAVVSVPGVKLGPEAGMASDLATRTAGGGQLISTSLLTIYLAPDRTLYIGSVTPSAILADAAHG